MSSRADFNWWKLEDREPIFEAISKVIVEEKADDWCHIKTIDKFVGNIARGEGKYVSEVIVDGVVPEAEWPNMDALQKKI
jgi:hypothetical protein